MTQGVSAVRGRNKGLPRGYERKRPYLGEKQGKKIEKDEWEMKRMAAMCVMVGRSCSGQKLQCVGETTLTPAYLLQYSTFAPSSLSVNDAGSGLGRNVDWRGGAGNGLRVGVGGVLSGEPILGIFAKSG